MAIYYTSQILGTPLKTTVKNKELLWNVSG